MLSSSLSMSEMSANLTAAGQATPEQPITVLYAANPRHRSRSGEHRRCSIYLHREVGAHTPE